MTLSTERGPDAIPGADAVADAPWHRRDAAAAAAMLGTDPVHGLTGAEAQRRLAAHGPNRLPEPRRLTWLRILWQQFKDVMVLVLLAAAAVSVLVGEAQDTVVIFAVVLLNGVIGFIQQFRSERAMQALRQMAAPNATMLRDGETRAIPAADVVPGDVVLLEAGNFVPADLRLCFVADLQTAEAALTGESQPCLKQSALLQGGTEEIALADRSNMAYSGTTVVRGRGRGLVIATGGATEIGRIARSLAESRERETPLERRLADLVRRLAIAVFVICAAFFGVGLLRGEPVLPMLLTAVSLAVAAVPEALPAVVTIALAFGAVRMVRHKVLARRLAAVEALGSITVICSDKTGTLTENRMGVEGYWVDGETTPQPDQSHWSLLFDAMCLNNDAQGGGEGVIGDPTEAAFLAAAAAAGHAALPLTTLWPRIGEVPFDADRRRMTTLHRGATLRAFMKGAPEIVLPRCARRLTAAGPAPLDLDAAERAVSKLAAAGQRVLAFGYRDFDASPDDLAAEERDFVLLGLVGLIDPPRAGVVEAVAECRRAGIRPVMITGDHPTTAEAIAARLGLLLPGEAVLTGPALSRLDDAALAERIERVHVFARVDPGQKVRIVEALQARGEIVAMTGDGVNDAPALKRSDIGVAMGRMGTDVAREAAGLVLLDDSFPSIVAAVREGRRIYDNIRKFLRYIVATNLGELCTLFLAPLIGLPLPLLPVHILWINLATDSLPSLALATDPAEPDVMRRPPRRPDESLFAGGLWQHVVWVGLLMAGLCLSIQALALNGDADHSRSMVFTAMTLCQLGHVLAIRVSLRSVIGRAFFGNRWLLGAVGLVSAMLGLSLYTAQGNALLRLTPLSAADLALCIGAGLAIFAAVEIEKAWRRWAAAHLRRPVKAPENQP